MVFLANVWATLERAAAATDVYGRVTLGSPEKVKIAIINLELTREKTSVRTDSSATRGNADEVIATRVRVLFPKSTEPARGDKVTVEGREIKVISVFPRHNIRGVVEHFQVDGDVWSDQ